jgi:hypothetical protein
MGRSAGRISIDLNAGTAQFLVDMDKANASVNKFGANARAAGGHGVTGVQAVSGALRVLEGGLTNNLRAAERFTANVLGLGPILQAAFPLIGAVAFAGILVKLGEEATKFYTTMRDAPEKVRGTWASMSLGLRITNDELRVTDDVLKSQIAKLEGRRQNVLKEELDRAREAADKLADSLDKDLQKLNAFLKEQQTSFMEQIFGQASDKGLREELGGKTGTGGFASERRDIERRYMDEIAAEKDKTKQAALRSAMDAELRTANLHMIAELTKQQRVLEEQSRDHVIERTLHSEIGGDEVVKTTVKGRDNAKIIEEYKAAIDSLREQSDFIPLQAAVTTDENRKRELDAARDNARVERPLQNKLAEIEAAIASARKRMEGIGMGELAKSIADGKAKALEAIAEVEKAERRLNANAKGLTQPQKQNITDKEVILAQVEAEDKWKTKLSEATAKVNDQTLSQKMLTDAIGKGYAAVKSAAVETSVMKEVGAERYQDFLKNGANAADVMAVRAATAAAYEENHRREMAETGQTLKEQTELSVRLAQVQYLGEQAVRLATLQHTLELMRQKGASQELLDAETRRFAAERENDISKSVADINVKIEAIDRMAAAELRGAAAVRQAALENKIADIRRQGDQAIPGVIGIGQKELATRTEDFKAQNEEIAKSAGERINEFNNSIAKLNNEKALLEAVLELHKGDLDTMRALRDVEDARLKIAVQYELSQRSAAAGLRAFFLEMQEQAKSAAAIMYDALNKALDDVADNMARLLSAEKTDWAKMFKQIGQEMEKQSIKAGLQQGLGQLGKVLGVKIPGALQGKNDGSSPDKALWVRMLTGQAPGTTPPPNQQTAGQSPSVLGSLLGSLPVIGGLFKGLFKGVGQAASGVANSTISYGDSSNAGTFGGMMAGGGDIKPGTDYLVGEKGFEIFRSSQAGKMLSNSDSRRVLAAGSGGGDVYHVDARGAELGAYNRIMSALEERSQEASSTGIRGTQERQKRTPQRRS